MLDITISRTTTKVFTVPGGKGALEQALHQAANANWGAEEPDYEVTAVEVSSEKEV